MVRPSAASCADSSLIASVGECLSRGYCFISKFKSQTELDPPRSGKISARGIAGELARYDAERSVVEKRQCRIGEYGMIEDVEKVGRKRHADAFGERRRFSE